METHTQTPVIVRDYFILPSQHMHALPCSSTSLAQAELFKSDGCDLILDFISSAE